MKRNPIFISLLLFGALVLGALYWIRPPNGPTGSGTSSKLFTLSLPNKPQPHSFLPTIVAAGFTAVPDANLNSLLPSELRKPEFESLQAYRRIEASPSDTRLLGYRAGDTIAQLYVQTAGSQNHVKQFKQETEAIHAQLSK